MHSEFDLFESIYAGRRVLVTGHTGFKGSWLSLWLKKLGATVAGYSLPTPTSPSHFDILLTEKLKDIKNVIGNITDTESIDKAIREFNPEIVFHLAAQPIVLESYKAPVDTYETNVIGTMKVLDACRKMGTVKAIVCITTDKVYDNKEWCWGYRENDPLGGYDPYSSSKACCEIAIASFRNSFFPIGTFGIKHNTLVASARAGNVVGGGDWAANRLIPDLVRGAVAGEKANIRNPLSTRPWQHVLEPLAGYLLLGAKLLSGKTTFAEAWNFGPNQEGVANVQKIVTEMMKTWKELRVTFDPDPNAFHEAHLLQLDIAKSRDVLGWVPLWDTKTTFSKVSDWYQSWYKQGVCRSEEDIRSFVVDARTALDSKGYAI